MSEEEDGAAVLCPCAAKHNVSSVKMRSKFVTDGAFMMPLGVYFASPK